MSFVKWIRFLIPFGIVIAFMVARAQFGIKFNRFIPIIAIAIYAVASHILFRPFALAEQERLAKEEDAIAAAEFDKTDPVGTIEKRLARLSKANTIPGMVAGYQSAGGKLVAAASGVRKRDSGVAITVNDQLHIGSCTKAMTATMIARLVERKVLNWDTTIAVGLPELSKQIHADYHAVTLKELLMHRGGVPANGGWNSFADKATVTETRRCIVEAAMSSQPKLKHGQFEYSNLGYVVAGLIANKATGKPWEEFMQEEVFAPLKMETAGFGPPGTKGQADQPWGHVVSLGILVPAQEDNTPALGPAGTVHLSIADWAKFCRQHLPLKKTNGETSNEKSPEDIRLVSDTTLQLLHSLPEVPEDDPGADYALGWMKTEREWGGEVIVHSGSNTFWFATVWISQRDGTMFFSIANSATAKAEHAVDAVFATLIQLEAETRE